MKKMTCLNRAVGDWDLFPEYDVLWCDPPWGEGMLRLFARMAARVGHLPPADNLYAVLGALFRLADKRKPLFVEYSHKGTSVPLGIACSEGHRLERVSHCTQTNGKPFVVMNFNTPHYTVPDYTVGFDVVRGTVEALKPQVVFDPFAGMGKTAEAVVSAGACYVGSEMNPDRYRKMCKVAERVNNA